MVSQTGATRHELRPCTGYAILQAFHLPCFTAPLLPSWGQFSNDVHTNHLRVCFWGKANPLNKSFTISQKLTQASLPIISSPPTFLSLAAAVCLPLTTTHFNLTALASSHFSAWKIPIYHLNITSPWTPSQLSHLYTLNIVLLILPSPDSTHPLPTHPSIHPSNRYVSSTSICQAGTSMLQLSTGLPV